MVDVTLTSAITIQLSSCHFRTGKWEYLTGVFFLVITINTGHASLQFELYDTRDIMHPKRYLILGRIPGILKDLVLIYGLEKGFS